MKKLILIVALAAGVFGFYEAQAQRVIKSGNSIYIDASDIPSHSTTSLNRTSGYQTARNRVFRMFQVAKSDLPSKMQWATASGINLRYNDEVGDNQLQGSVNTGCRTYTEAGVSGWRVPTQKEVILMYAMKNVLSTAGLTLTNAEYWCSTEFNAGSAYVIDMQSGLMHRNASKGATNLLVRCVREM